MSLAYYLRAIVFHKQSKMILQWRIYHDKKPWTNDKYDMALYGLGLCVMVDPADGDMERYLKEHVHKQAMWPWLIYIQDEPDWALIQDHTWLGKNIIFVRAIRFFRKLWPRSKWYSAADLGVELEVAHIGDRFYDPVHW